MSPTLKKLRNRLEYRCDGSDDYVRCIRAITRTRDVDAVRILASLLDSTGPIAKAAMKALVSFGEGAVPAMRRCVESDDADMVAHGHEVLERVELRSARLAREGVRAAA